MSRTAPIIVYQSRGGTQALWWRIPDVTARHHALVARGWDSGLATRLSAAASLPRHSEHCSAIQKAALSSQPKLSSFGRVTTAPKQKEDIR